MMIAGYRRQRADKLFGYLCIFIICLLEATLFILFDAGGKTSEVTINRVPLQYRISRTHTGAEKGSAQARPIIATQLPGQMPTNIATQPINHHRRTDYQPKLNISYPYPRFRQCQEVFDDPENKEVVEAARLWEPPRRTDRGVLAISRNCKRFRKHYWFPRQPLSQLEADNPHAYTFMIHKDIEQVIQVLESIYWPQNWYCIHIDLKASNVFKETVRNIAQCFPNVIVSKESYKVRWGDITVLEAAMGCLNVLKNPEYKWSYVQIFSGVDLPMRTNAELVDIFKIMNGAMDCSLEIPKIKRFVFQWNNAETDDSSQYEDRITDILKSIPPEGLTIHKGGFQATMPRAFIEYIFSDPVAIQLYKWLNYTSVPDESYWATLHFNPQLNAPGNFPGICFSYYRMNFRSKPSMSRYQVWKMKKWGQNFGNALCYSRKFVHGSCVFGVADLSRLRDRPELSAHKFYGTYEPAAFACMHERLWNRTYFGQSKEIDYDYYKELPQIVWHNQNHPANFNCFSGSAGGH